MARAGTQRSERVKRRLLAEVVQENLDTIDGVRRGMPRPRRRGMSLRASLRWLGLVLPPLAAAGAWLAFESGHLSLPSRNLGPQVVPAGADEPSLAAAIAPSSASETTSGDLDAVASLDALSAVDPRVFPLAVRRIVLDPGHGGGNKGAMAPRATDGGPRLLEKDLTLDLARRLRLRLIGEGFQVALTRDRDQDVPLNERAALANAAQGDLFVSIHLNWFEGRRGVETYYLGPTADPELSSLAARENESSGYALADLRRLLDGMYVNLRRGESRALAAHVQRELFSSLREVSPALRDRGVKTAPFVVLVDTQMPAILAEVACLSDATEVELLRTDGYRDRIADALARGLRGYAEGVARPAAIAGAGPTTDMARSR